MIIPNKKRAYRTRCIFEMNVGFFSQVADMSGYAKIYGMRTILTSLGMKCFFKSPQLS